MNSLKNLLLPSAALALFLLGCQRSTPSPTAAVDLTNTGTVTVEIRSESGVESIEIENVASGTTVESLMRSIDQIPVTIRGSGVTAFVDSIGEKATSSSEGWTYQVDGEFANEGIGSTKLTPPATITWSYSDASEIAEK